jgi:hypothetical protein
VRVTVDLSDEAAQALDEAMKRGGPDVIPDLVIDSALILLLRVNNLAPGEVTRLYNTTPGRGMRALRMEILSD